MHYSISYKGINLVFQSVLDALKKFDKLNDVNQKELFLVDTEGKKTSLKKGVYVGRGSDMKTNGYRIYENNEILYDLRMQERAMSIAA